MGSLAAARFPLLLVCFFFSGFAALLYETAWTRQFGFVFGTSELAVAAVLAAYMAGLASGAALAGRFAQRWSRPVLAYGLLELGIALGALAVPYAIAIVSRAYLGLVGGLDAPPETVGLATALLHLAGAFVVLVPCTAMMGATLPLLARHAVQEETQVGPRVGLLYAINTAGAIAGTLCAAFWLLPGVGLRHTVQVGVAANALVFVAAALLSRGIPLAPLPEHVARLRNRLLLPAMAFSGAASFTYEVLWVRMLGHVLGGSTAAFSTMLASFLLGIALGSAVAARFARSASASLRGFAIAQVGTAGFGLAAFALADRLPELAHGLGASAHELGPGIALAGSLLLPMTLCIGATFPLAVRAVVEHAEDASVASARVYAWNTVGSIAGSISAGFLWLPWLGLEGTVALAAALNLALAAAGLGARGARLPAAALGACALLLPWLPIDPPERLLKTSALTGRVLPGELDWVGIGRSATVTVVDDGDRWRLMTNGLPEAAIDRAENPPQRTLARWLSMAPVLYRPQSESMAIIGLGGGVTVGAVPPSVSSVDVIELEPNVVAANRRLADRRGGSPLADPRVRVVIGDARGALVLSKARYDAIVSQPSHPWTSGSAHLYTREFFALVRRHLAPDGIFVQWIGLNFVSEAQFRSLLATLHTSFAHVEVLRPRAAGVLFVASNGPLDLPASSREALARSPRAFAEEGVYTPADALSAWVLDAAATRALGAGAPANTDDHNRLAVGQAVEGGLPRWPDALFAGNDPLARPRGVDPAALGRRLATQWDRERASRAASSLSRVDQRILLGWHALSRQRPREALAHFDAADALEPGRDAVRQGRLLLPFEGPARETLPPRERALVDALRFGDDREALEALEPLLQEWQPSDLLYPEAVRARARWRLLADDPDEAREALALIDSALPVDAVPADYYSRALAAHRAGRTAAAWSSLERLVDALARKARPHLVVLATELARELPAHPRAERVRARLGPAAQPPS